VEAHFDLLGQWLRRCGRPVALYTDRDSIFEYHSDGAAVTYHTDAATFQAVVSGLQTPQEAFFEQRIAITGDLETALKLAVLFGQFLAEQPVPQHHRTEAMNATPFQP